MILKDTSLTENAGAYICVYVHVYIFMHMYVCMSLYICIYVYVYTYPDNAACALLSAHFRALTFEQMDTLFEQV